MSTRWQNSGILATVLLLVGFLVIPAISADKPQTVTGVVSDAMCGAKHMMPGDPVACLRACVSKGSKYALVVGDKVYTLDTSDKTALGALDKLANEKAKVTGTVKGDTIAVSSVSPAM